MNIITIGREFGSGGRELGKKIAEMLGYKYYDKEIISTIAERHNLNENYVENGLISIPVPTINLTFGHSFVSPLYVDAPKTELLLEQRRVIEEIASKGENFVIIGRNSDVILQKYAPFNVFVTADLEDKIQRCLSRAKDNGENFTTKEIKRKIIKIDKARKRARFLITEKDWGHKNSYHIIVNSTGWNLDLLASSICSIANNYFKDLKPKNNERNDD